MNDRQRSETAEPRARYLEGGSEPAFALTKGQLGELVREAVAEALAVRPLLVDKAILGQLLQCSAAHIDNLRKVGLPVVKVGESVRFDPTEVMAWLKGRLLPENDR